MNADLRLSSLALVSVAMADTCIHLKTHKYSNRWFSNVVNGFYMHISAAISHWNTYFILTKAQLMDTTQSIHKLVGTPNLNDSSGLQSRHKGHQACLYQHFTTALPARTTVELLSTLLIQEFEAAISCIPPSLSVGYLHFITSHHDCWIFFWKLQK